MRKFEICIAILKYILQIKIDIAIQNYKYLKHPKASNGILPAPSHAYNYKPAANTWKASAVKENEGPDLTRSNHTLKVFYYKERNTFTQSNTSSNFVIETLHFLRREFGTQNTCKIYVIDYFTYSLYS